MAKTFVVRRNLLISNKKIALYRKFFFSNLKKLILLLSCFFNFIGCTKEKNCFEISKKVNIDEKYFFYWGKINSGNIDEFSPPAKTGEVSESDYNSYIEGDLYCPN